MLSAKDGAFIAKLVRDVQLEHCRVPLGATDAMEKAAGGLLERAKRLYFFNGECREGCLYPIAAPAMKEAAERALKNAVPTLPPTEDIPLELKAFEDLCRDCPELSLEETERLAELESEE